MDNKTLSEQYAEIGAEWADYEAAASLLEDTKSAVLSQMIIEHMRTMGDTAHNKAEAYVKSSPDWIEYVTKTVEARRLANLWRVKKEVIHMRHSEQMSQAANERIVAKL